MADGPCKKVRLSTQFPDEQVNKVINKYMSSVFACETSGDSRYIRCDFSRCSKHQVAGQSNSWLLNTVRNVRFLENHVGLEIYKFIKCHTLDFDPSQTSHYIESDHIITNQKLPPAVNKVLVIFNLCDPQSQLGEWISLFYKAALQTQGFERSNTVILTQSFSCRYELFRCIARLEFLGKYAHVDVAAVLSCHSSSQGQVFSCTPVALSKHYGFEEFCSLHDFVCACQDVLQDSLSAIHISSCFTLKMDCSHVDWPVHAEWITDKLACVLSGSSREVYETGSQIADLFVLLSMMMSTCNFAASLKDAVTRACTKACPDLAREMGLGLMHSDKMKESLRQQGREDKVTPASLVMSTVRIVLLVVKSSSANSQHTLAQALMANLRMRQQSDIKCQFMLLEIDPREISQTFAQILKTIPNDQYNNFFVALGEEFGNIESLEVINDQFKECPQVYGVHFHNISTIQSYNIITHLKSEMSIRYSVTSALDTHCLASYPVLLYMVHLALGENGERLSGKSMQPAFQNSLSNSGVSLWTLDEVYMETSFVLSGLSEDCGLRLLSRPNFCNNRFVSQPSRQLSLMQKQKMVCSNYSEKSHDQMQYNSLLTPSQVMGNHESMPTSSQVSPNDPQLRVPSTDVEESTESMQVEEHRHQTETFKLGVTSEKSNDCDVDEGSKEEFPTDDSKIHDVKLRDGYDIDERSKDVEFQTDESKIHDVNLRDGYDRDERSKDVEFQTDDSKIHDVKLRDGYDIDERSEGEEFQTDESKIHDVKLRDGYDRDEISKDVEFQTDDSKIHDVNLRDGYDRDERSKDEEFQTDESKIHDARYMKLRDDCNRHDRFTDVELETDDINKHDVKLRDDEGSKEEELQTEDSKIHDVKLRDDCDGDERSKDEELQTEDSKIHDLKLRDDCDKNERADVNYFRNCSIENNGETVSKEIDTHVTETSLTQITNTGTSTDQQWEKSGDLPLMANVDEFRVKHYILNLSVDFDTKIMKGDIVLFLDVMEDDNEMKQFELCLDSTLVNIESVEEIHLPEEMSYKLFNSEWYCDKCNCSKQLGCICMKESATQSDITLDNIQEYFTCFSKQQPCPLAFKGLSYSTYGWCVVIWKPNSTKQEWPRCIRIQYHTSPEGQSLAWATDQDERPCVFTPGAYINNRSLMPCQEPPMATSTWQAVITVPKDCTVLMSGDQLLKDEQNQTTYYYEMVVPLPCSTLALAIGYFAHRELLDVAIPCQVYASPSLIKQAAEQLLSNAALYLDAACSLLGPYPFSRLQLLIMPKCFACMGLKSPNIAFLSQSVLCSNKSMCLRVAHEISHAWFGLLVGAKDWTEEWLSEGFATFVEDTIQLLAEKNSNKEDKDRLELRQILRYRALHTELQDTDKSLQVLRPKKVSVNSVPLSTRKRVTKKKKVESPSPHSVVKHGQVCSKKWTQVHYLKGYFLLLYMSQTVGTEALHRFLRDYLQKYRGQLVTSQEFFDYFMTKFSSVDGVDLHHFKGELLDWLEGAGMPKSLKGRESNIPSDDNLLVKHAIDEFNIWKKRDTTNKRNKTKRVRTRTKSEDIVHIHLSDPEQLVLMLEKLLERECISHTTLRQLNACYHFTDCNTEIRHRWCELIVKHRYNAGFPEVKRYLIEDQGMGIYLFGELIISQQPKQRAIAEEVFEIIGAEMDRCTHRTVLDMLTGQE